MNPETKADQQTETSPKTNSQETPSDAKPEDANTAVATDSGGQDDTNMAEDESGEENTTVKNSAHNDGGDNLIEIDGIQITVEDMVRAVESSAEEIETTKLALNSSRTENEKLQKRISELESTISRSSETHVKNSESSTRPSPLHSLDIGQLADDLSSAAMVLRDRDSYREYVEQHCRVKLGIAAKSGGSSLQQMSNAAKKTPRPQTNNASQQRQSSSVTINGVGREYLKRRIGKLAGGGTESGVTADAPPSKRHASSTATAPKETHNNNVVLPSAVGVLVAKTNGRFNPHAALERMAQLYKN